MTPRPIETEFLMSLDIEVGDSHILGDTPDAIRRIAAGEEVPASDYYLRNAPFFETATPAYAWLNYIVAVGLGERIPGGARYDIYQVL